MSETITAEPETKAPAGETTAATGETKPEEKETPEEIRKRAQAADGRAVQAVRHQQADQPPVALLPMLGQVGAREGRLERRAAASADLWMRHGLRHRKTGELNGDIMSHPMRDIDYAIAILHATNDGNNLTPAELRMVELAANHGLSAAGRRAR